VFVIFKVWVIPVEQDKEIMPSLNFFFKRVISKSNINLENPIGLEIPPSP